MSLLPKRRKREPMGVQKSAIIRCPQHLAFVRLHCCSVPNCDQGPIEAAHDRSCCEGGMGIKPGDDKTYSLCSAHHREQHTIGDKSFAHKYGISPPMISASMWAISPAGKRYRMKCKDL